MIMLQTNFDLTTCKPFAACIDIRHGNACPKRKGKTILFPGQLIKELKALAANFKIAQLPGYKRWEDKSGGRDIPWKAVTRSWKR